MMPWDIVKPMDIGYQINLKGSASRQAGNFSRNRSSFSIDRLA